MACAAAERPRGGLGLDVPDLCPGNALMGEEAATWAMELDREAEREADAGGSESGWETPDVILESGAAESGVDTNRSCSVKQLME